MRSESIFWGLVLLLLGGFLLLNNLGILPQDINVWTIFWPMVLIILGLRGVIGAFTSRSAETESLSIPLEGTQRLRMRISHGAGELRIDNRAGNDELLNGSFAGGAEQHLRRSGDEAVLELRVPSQNFPMFWSWNRSNAMNWTIGLNPAVETALDLEVGASRNMLDLRGLLVKELRLQTGASATVVDLPARAGYTRAKINAGAASVEVRIPEGVAARIHTSGGLASIDIDSLRFPRTGSEYRSSDYETAENRVDVDIETGLGSVRVQ